MVLVPAGKFTMGLSEAQVTSLAKEYSVDESVFGLQGPQRTEHVEAFLIDRYPVTHRQYQEFIDATGHRPPEIWEKGKYPGGSDDCPVTGVNWEDANAYADWAGKRLPTDTEWEKAARGTDGRLYPWGNEWKEKACCRDEAKSPGDFFGPVPVGTCDQDISPYGLMDMSGNVTEWTATDALNAGQWKGFKMARGGNFTLSQAYNFITTARVAQPPANGHTAYLGFRCAKNVIEDETTSDASFTPSSDSFKREKLPATRPELYLREPIKIYSGGEAIAHRESFSFRVPHLPGDSFSLMLMEGIFHHANKEWVNSHNYTYNKEHTVATNRWSEPPKTTGRLEMEVELRGAMDCVTIRIGMKNISNVRRDMDFTLDSCFSSVFAPNFRDHEGSRTFIYTDDGFVPINQVPRRVYDRLLLQFYPQQLFRAPFLAIVSRNGDWLISQTAVEAESLFNNWEYGCQHPIPPLVSLDAGEEKIIENKIYFLRNKLEDLLERWRRDFHIN